MRRPLLAGLVTSLVAALLLPMGTSSGADPDKPVEPPAPDPCTNHLAYQVDESGFFNIGAGTNDVCEPQDGAWDLMYRWPSGPGTSYTSVRTADGVFVLGRDVQPDYGTDNPPGDTDTSSSRTYTLPGDIQVTQHLEIVEGLTPGRLDAVRISYTVENLSGAPAQADVRVMLDTELDYNDGAAFQVPRVGAVTTELELEGDQVPDYFAAFKDFEDPVHVAAGILRSPGDQTPERVVFADWSRIYNSTWDYEPTAGQPITRDSAVAMYFQPHTTGGLVPGGGSVEYAAKYGRASASSDLRPPLALSLLAPAQVTLGTPFQVSAFVTNVGNDDAIRPMLRIYAPNGFDIGDDIFRSLSDPMAPNTTELVTWTVTPTWDGLIGEQPISVVVAADNAPAKLVTRMVNVLGGDETTGPYPLLGAHGITGRAEDMTIAMEQAQDTVPEIEGTFSVPTGATSSVWLNGTHIEGYAQDMIDQTGADKVNVIAHSKGGLDTRYAMWLHPELFDTLGMLATPNAGSKGADKLCWLRRHSSNAQSQFGACDSEWDGLYNLQTGWMADVFNPLVRDDARHLKVVAAGDCTGLFHVKCNVARDYLGCQRNDTAVCMESAFARTREYGDGLAHALQPIFRYNHTQMRTEHCSIHRVLAELYPLDSVRNDWLYYGSCGGGPDDTWPMDGRTASSSTAAFAARTTEEAAPATVPVDAQESVTGAASPAAPLRYTFDPEGAATGLVEVYLPAGRTAEVRVLRPDGSVDAAAAVTEDELFGETSYAVELSGLAGAKRTVEITPDQATEVGLFSSVARGTRRVSATVTPAGNDARIEVTTSGIPGGQASAARVVASWRDAGGVRRETTLVRSSKDGVFRATVALPRGGYVPVDVTYADAALRRALIAGIALPDGSGSFTGLGASNRVDTDGDGREDALRLPVRVRVDHPGDYQVAVDLAQNGSTLLSAPGSATLAAGDGVVPVDVPFAELLRVGRDGPFQVRRAILSRGTVGRTIVATADDLGSTGTFELASVTSRQVVLSAPTGAGVDTDDDGRLDELRFAGNVTVPSAGDYLVNATLRDPRGRVVSVHETTRTLHAGLQGLVVPFPGELVGANGSGVYSLVGLTATAVDDPSLTDTVHGSYTGALRSSDWVGGTPAVLNLREMWNAAQATGAISPYGFYVSQDLRLGRVQEYVDGSQTARAKAELTRFLDDVAARPGGVQPAWRSRILGYGRLLSATM